MIVVGLLCINTSCIVGRDRNNGGRLRRLHGSTRYTYISSVDPIQKVIPKKVT